ncbi:MAG: hypothetical protein ACOC80_03240, partial [Petrotogales bacterium]
TEEKIPTWEPVSEEAVEEAPSPESKVEELTEWPSYDIKEEKPKDELQTDKPYKYGEYTLYKKEIKTSTGKKRTVRFFSKKKPDVGEAVPLPEGYEVKINKRNKVPYLRRKK